MEQDRPAPQSDHDLLIRVDENLRNMRIHIETLTGDTTKKLDDHENRIRRLEKYTWLAIGALTVVQILVAVLK